MLDRYRRAPNYLLPLPPLILLALAHLPASAANLDWIAAIGRVTHGVVTPLFVLSLIALGLMLALMFLPGKLEADDIGLDRDHLGRGVGILLMTWLAAQVFAVLPRVVAEDPVAIHETWLRGQGLTNAANLLSALGLAAAMDTALIGFLLVQLYLRFHRDDSRDSHQGVDPALAITVLVGCLLSLVLVGLHSANRTLLLTLAVSLAAGVYLCWIYLRSRNLFFTIGVHMLLLAPTPVVAGIRGEPAWFHSGAIALVAAIWTLLWPRRD